MARKLNRYTKSEALKLWCPLTTIQLDDGNIRHNNRPLAFNHGTEHESYCLGGEKCMFWLEDDKDTVDGEYTGYCGGILS